MKQAYKYKIKPTEKQKHLLNQFFGSTRFIYNWGLDRKIKEYKQNKKSINYLTLAKELTILKNTEGFEWLSNCANECLQQSLRNLDNAYTRFFREKKGFPKFKSKKNSKNVCKFINNVHFDFENNKVKIPKIGWTKLCQNREFDTEKVKIGTLTVEMDKCGDYWCVIMTDDGEQCKPKAKICIETAVGVDLGIKDYTILSDGTKYGNPKFLEKGQKRLKILQRKFSKSKKGSKRCEVLKIKIAKLHRKIVNRRCDFTNKLSKMLVDRFDTICLEDLNVEGMLKNGRLANSIQGAAWSEFIRQIVYKCEFYGKNAVFIGRFEPSSQICHCCGYRNADVKDLRLREWVCPECGSHHDRDVNAAINILNFGLHPQSLVAVENKIPQGSGIKGDEGNVIGHPVKRQYSKS